MSKDGINISDQEGRRVLHITNPEPLIGNRYFEAAARDLQTVPLTFPEPHRAADGTPLPITPSGPSQRVTRLMTGLTEPITRICRPIVRCKRCKLPLTRREHRDIECITCLRSKGHAA